MRKHRIEYKTEQSEKTMTVQLPLISAEELERCVKPPPPRPDWYVVIASCYDSYWSLRKGWYENLAEAQAAVGKLTSAWRHVRIVRIPGEQP